jgi:protein SCO1/2
MIICLWWLLAACSVAPSPEAVEPPAPIAALPSDSVYQLGTVGVTHTGANARLDTFRGHPTLITMFYASCPTACPMLIEDIKGFEAGLSDAQRADLRVVLVSLDPAADTPERLQQAMTDHGVDASRWVMLRTEPDAVREVAAALGIRYRPAPNGEMNHSSILTLVDRDGRPVVRVEGLRRDPSALRVAMAELQTGGAL